MTLAVIDTGQHPNQIFTRAQELLCRDADWLKIYVLGPAEIVIRTGQLNWIESNVTTMAQWSRVRLCRNDS